MTLGIRNSKIGVMGPGNAPLGHRLNRRFDPTAGVTVQEALNRPIEIYDDFTTSTFSHRLSNGESGVTSASTATVPHMITNWLVNHVEETGTGRVKRSGDAPGGQCTVKPGVTASSWATGVAYSNIKGYGDCFSMASDAATPIYWESLIEVKQVAKTHWFAGLGQGGDTRIMDDGEHYVGFRFSDLEGLAGGNARFVTQTGSAETVTDTGLNLGSDPCVYSMEWNGTDTVKAYMNGKIVAVHTTKLLYTDGDFASPQTNANILTTTAADLSLVFEAEQSTYDTGTDQGLAISYVYCWQERPRLKG